MCDKRNPSSAELVLDAVFELHSLEQIVTRAKLADHLNLKLSIIDDKLKTLANDGLIDRAERGVYVPVIKHPPSRVMSHMVLPCGMEIIDIGDDVLKLTPRETRTLAVMLAGRASQATDTHLANQVSSLAAELVHSLRAIEKNSTGGD